MSLAKKDMIIKNMHFRIFGLITVILFFVFCIIPLQSDDTPIHECARSGNNDILIALLESIPPSKLQLTVNKRSSVSESHCNSRCCKLSTPKKFASKFPNTAILLPSSVSHKLVYSRPYH